ncbi:unnamed protein product, partial [Discosporangium mesarthrocarpum]
TNQEWSACLGHDSIGAALRLAERAFTVWKALAKAMLAKAEANTPLAAPTKGTTIGRIEPVPAVTGGGKGGRGRDWGKGKRRRRMLEEAVREVARCSEEEAYMRYMVARDVWGKAKKDSGRTDDRAGARGGTASLPVSPPGPPHPQALANDWPLENGRGGGGIFFQRSLDLFLESAKLRNRQRSLHLQLEVAPGQPLPPAGEPEDDTDTGSGVRVATEKDLGAESSKAKAPGKSTTGGGGTDSGGVGNGGTEKGEVGRGGRGVPWSIPFMIGKLRARLGGSPRMVLQELGEAVRLAKAEDVCLEDELEALCRLHSYRAELLAMGPATEL